MFCLTRHLLVSDLWCIKIPRPKNISSSHYIRRCHECHPTTVLFLGNLTLRAITSATGPQNGDAHILGILGIHIYFYRVLELWHVIKRVYLVVYGVPRVHSAISKTALGIPWQRRWITKISGFVFPPLGQ